jgi:diguanylate cyclase (GGDEF)-like protein
MGLRRIFNSIITRLILFGTAIAIVTATGRYFMIADFLREDLERVVSAQQEALAGYVARDIDFKIQERQKMLKRLTEALPIELIDRPGELRAWLGERHEFQPLFSQGLFLTDVRGIAIADYPVLPNRTGASYHDRDYIQAALNGGTAVGRVILGRAANQPIVPIAVPVKDSTGKVLAVLAGITATAAPGFFDLLQQIRIGETGGFLLIDPKEQVFVAATKPELILQPTAAPGINALHDKALKGWRGSGITLNAQGIEEIAAFASVPSTGWFVVARLPTAEAFSSVKRAQHYVIRNAAIIISIFIVILVGGLAYIFRPLATAADHAMRMTSGDLPLAPLPVAREDEVGHLTAAFNRLLEKLMASRAELAQMASHDPLTGLPNRLLLADRMHQTLARSNRNGTGLAVLFLDLDSFKPINDRLGHEAGDLALIEIARRLSSVVREADTLARVGGDEFVVVIGDLDGVGELAQSAACAVASKCIEVLSTPMNIKNEMQSVGISIGIAMGTGASSFDDLLSAADTAMYRAKQTGKGRYALAERVA